VKKKPRTDFTELRSPFSITDGLYETPETTMISPLLRVQAEGKADLVEETLAFRVEPKFVATIKGQGDTMERSGIMVPVLVSGTFSSPTFRPDLEGMIKQGIGELAPKLPELKEGLQAPADLEERLKKLPDLKESLPESSDLNKALPAIPALGEESSQPTELNETADDQVKKKKRRREENTTQDSDSLEGKVEELIKSVPKGE
jgi:hypothetical protein